MNLWKCTGLPNKSERCGPVSISPYWRAPKPDATVRQGPTNLPARTSARSSIKWERQSRATRAAPGTHTTIASGGGSFHLMCTPRRKRSASWPASRCSRYSPHSSSPAPPLAWHYCSSDRQTKGQPVHRNTMTISLPRATPDEVPDQKRGSLRGGTRSGWSQPEGNRP